MTPPDAEHAAFLERVRRSGISIDSEGRFWHEGETVRHEGLRRALWRWLDSLPDGRTVLRLDADRFAYVEVADTPLVATSLRWQADEALLGLNDGGEEALDPASLTVDEAGVMRCQVRAGRLRARLANAAASTLAERIEESASGPILRVGTRRIAITAAPRPAPR